MVMGDDGSGGVEKKTAHTLLIYIIRGVLLPCLSSKWPKSRFPGLKHRNIIVYRRL